MAQFLRARSDEVVEDLSILNEDALSYYLENEEVRESADVVITNPPYVKIEAQNAAIRERVSQVLGEGGEGRPDLYLAVLKIAVELLKLGGYGLFVLPEAFLKSESALTIRRLIAEQCWIHCIVDLTAVRVFEDLGVYTILLIFQRKHGALETAPIAKVVQCQDQIAQTLQDVLDDRVVDTKFYSIHETTQAAFAGDEWNLASPSIATILKKYAKLAELSTECILRQGMNTGADDVFIMRTETVPNNEGSVWAPLLSDREMEFYTVPNSVHTFVFYPYRDGNMLNEAALKADFPSTWAYLESHRTALQRRSAVSKGSVPWWRPERPRSPKDMFRAKIVTPHVVIAPRFGLDIEGTYAISRAPILLSKRAKTVEREHLFYLISILNSTACFWHIAQRSYIYQRGYSRLEISRLAGTRIPSFASADKAAVRKLIRLVEARLEAAGQAALEIENEMDVIVSDLYGLDSDQRQLLAGGEGV